MGKFTEFKLALSGLPQGDHRREFHLGKQFFVNMENTDIHDADLKVKLDIRHEHEMYDMTFHISGTVTLICDRCLDSLVMPLETTYHVVVKYGDAFNDETDELLVIPYEDSSLNVAYMIYDTVVLAIPMKHVHQPGKCNRAMSAVLRKHRPGPAMQVDADEAALEQDLIDEMDTMDSADSAPADTPSDPRWDELKKLTDNN